MAFSQNIGKTCSFFLSVIFADFAGRLGTISISFLAGVLRVTLVILVKKLLGFPDGTNHVIC